MGQDWKSCIVFKKNSNLDSKLPFQAIWTMPNNILQVVQQHGCVQ